MTVGGVDGIAANVPRANRIRAGAGSIWVGAVTADTPGSPRVRGSQVLAQINPRTGRVRLHRWPAPTDFVVARGALWSFVGRRLVKRNPRTFRVMRTSRSANPNGDIRGVRFGLGNFWMAVDEQVDDDSTVLKISPTRGRVASGSGPGFADSLPCAVPGLGSVWASQSDPLDGGPWNLLNLSRTNLNTIASGAFPGAPPSGGDDACVAVGGGSVWISDDQPTGTITQIRP